MDRTTLTERLRRAEAEIAAGRAAQALAHCQELQTAYPRALRVQRVLGEVYLALRRPREALAALDRALAGNPEDVRACCARALVHQMHGDNVAALAWYRRACDLRPDDQALRATYRDLARRLGEPPYRPSRAGLARLYLRGDLFAHAIREWEQLVTESPDMLDAQVGLAETLFVAGHARAAEERCRRILANAPSCVKAMLIQMSLSLADGDMDTARAHLDRTLQLDPEMTLAQAWFADALAAGDPVLTSLLRPARADADEAVRSQPSAGYAQSGPMAGQRNLSRPLVTSAPMTGGPAFAPPPPTSHPLPPPPRPDVPVPSQPTEVTRAFRETAFMIWGKDEDGDSQPRLAAQQPAGAATDAEPGAPPVLRELHGTPDDEETKRALNWYNWLQSQGAVALGTAVASPPPMPPVPPPPASPAPSAPSNPQRVQSMAGPLAEEGDDVASRDVPAPPQEPMHNVPSPASGSPKLTMPIPSSRQTMPFNRTDFSAMGLSEPGDEPATAPLPLPPSDALRTMFAELGGAASGTPVVDAGSVGDGSADLDVVESDMAAEQSEYDAESGLGAPLWPAAPDEFTPGLDVEAVSDAEADMYAPAATDDDFAVTPRDAQPAGQPDESVQPAQTLEDLERQFSASGFTQIETRPGLLADIERIERAGASLPRRERPPEDEPASATATEAAEATENAEDSTPAEPTEPMNPSIGELVPAGPDPRDYPARLAHARQRRDEGQIDDALNEYRAVIKNAPDLLPEVLSDLNASLEELPDHPNLHSVLGDALVSQGQYEQALEAYNRATALAQARSNQDGA